VAAPVLAQPTDPGHARLERPPGAEFFHTPLGLCEDYPEETTTAAVYNADFDLLRSTGIDVLRISFGWDGIEEEKDRYDWHFWDDLVETAVDRYGITLIPYICYTPRWNATRQEDEYFWRSPPVDYDEFGEFVFDLVSRYRDRIKTWELWNEPDIPWFWMGTTEEFARLVKVGSDAVRRADPEARVVLGGIAYNPDYIRDLFRDHGVSPYVDIVNMHSYYETWNSQPLETIGPFIHRVDEVVNRYGSGQPLWMAEVGYSTLRYNGYTSNDHTNYYAYEHTPEYQAVHLARTISAALATDKLSHLAWYEIKDLPPTEEVIGDNNNRHLGIAYADHSPKPAQQALRFINQLYAEPMRSLDREVRVDRTMDSDVVVHAFEQQDGDVIVAAWMKTRKIGRQNDPGEGKNADTRREEVELVVPRATHGVATLYDELGNAQPHAGTRRDDDRTVVPLTLEGGKVYLVHVARHEVAAR
jgi:polysaccharide biosynthesis protein PslG